MDCIKGGCYGELLAVCTFLALVIACLVSRLALGFVWELLNTRARVINKVRDASSLAFASNPDLTETETDTDPESDSLAFISSEDICGTGQELQSGHRSCLGRGLCFFPPLMVWFCLVYHWRCRAVSVILAAEMNDEELEAVARVRASQEFFVEQARRLNANGSWPAKGLELDVVGAGGGFRTAANGAGIALLFALEQAGLLKGVHRTRGASAGSSAAILRVSKLWEPTGFISWMLRQPRFFNETVGLSVLWRLVIPFETWFTPSFLQALGPGDYRRLSGRIWIAYTRGCLRGGFQEAETTEFSSNEAVTAALSKSMMIPFIYPLGNTLTGLRHGEIVLDAGVSRDYPLFLDGLRPQLVLGPRRELTTYAPSPLPRMTQSLIDAQHDLFDLLRRWDGRGDKKEAMELVPAGLRETQCANARLNDWPAMNWGRRLFISEPDLKDIKQADVREAWRMQLQYAFRLNDSVVGGCLAMAPRAGDVEPTTVPFVRSD